MKGDFVAAQEVKRTLMSSIGDPNQFKSSQISFGAKKEDVTKELVKVSARRVRLVAIVGFGCKFELTARPLLLFNVQTCQ